MSVFSNLWDRIKSHSVPKSDERQRREKQFREGNRLMIFKDHDSKGRSILFDSRHDEATGSNPKEAPSGRKKPLADTKLFGEMMFGSAPMPHKTSTLKVHAIRSPPQLMITKVFLPVPINHESTGDHESFDLYSIQIQEPVTDKPTTAPQTIGDTGVRYTPQSLACSLPLDVPCCQSNRIDIFLPTRDDSGFSTSAASSPSSVLTNNAPSPSSSSANLSGSYNGRCRRYQQHQRTHLELSLSSSLPYDQTEVLPLHKRPVKIGIGIIFMLNSEDAEQNARFQKFFFSHIMLIESYVLKLKASVDEALAARSRAIICKAMDAFFSSVYALYTAPRIPRPIWLDVMTHRTQKSEICFKFVAEFMSLAKAYHTKGSHFFLSCLITAVLTHHLSWASTVAPVGDSPATTYLGRPHSKSLKRLARSHPYNPLWAQLGDLYGAIGFPCCMSRTVVVGRKAQLVEKFLRLLTYFIRCSELVENKERFPLLNASDSMDTCSPPSPCDSAASVIGVLMGDSASTAANPGASAHSVESSTEMMLRTSEPTADQPRVRAAVGRVHFQRGSSPAKAAITDEDVFENPVHVENGDGKTDDAMLAELKASGVRVLNARPAFLLRRDIPAQVFDRLSRHSGCNGLKINCEFRTDCSKDGTEVVLDVSRDTLPKILCETVDVGQAPSPSDSEKERKLCCQLSPNVIKEEAPKERVRALGREVVLPPPIVIPVSPVEKLHVDNEIELVDSVRRDSNPSAVKSCARTLQYGSSIFDEYFEKCEPSKSAREPSLVHEDAGNPVANANLPAENTLAVTSPPTFRRGTSMYDEYFDDPDACSVIDLIIHSAVSVENVAQQSKNSRPASRISVICDPQDLDEIMNEPLPDLDAIEKPLRTESTYSKKPLENNLSNGSTSKASVRSSPIVFQRDHFGPPPVTHSNGKHLVDLPDGPSKQRLHSTIELIRDVYAGRPDVSDEDSEDEGLHGGLTTPAVVGILRNRQRHASGQSNSSARCRSTTPCDGCGPKRRPSTASYSSDVHSSTLLNRLVEVPIPPSCNEVEDEDSSDASASLEFNLGRSLLAGYCPQYQSDFVLHGAPNSSSLKAQLHRDLQLALKNPALDERIDEASCIIADVDNWKVELYSCKYNAPDSLKVQPLVASQLVCGIVESMLDFWQMKASPEFCLMHLEDQLQSIYLKSKLLAEYIKVYRQIFPLELAAMHGFDVSDMPLLLAVAGTHSPDLHRVIASSF